jgi:dUTP pyrophosphatase
MAYKETHEQSTLNVVKLSSKAYIPTKGSSSAAGFDLYSAYNYLIPPQDKVLVKTDLQICVPYGTYGRIAPRSGLALNYHIHVGAGVIDQDYTGNVGIVLFNLSPTDQFKIDEGDRVAQLICEKITYPNLVEVASLNKTLRSGKGFGSTGK